MDLTNLTKEEIEDLIQALQKVLPQKQPRTTILKQLIKGQHSSLLRQALQYVKNQTPAICQQAVKQNGHALKHAQHQTEEICQQAVKQNGHALKHAQHQTEEICQQAVKQNGHALYYVKHQTEEICLQAIKQNGHTLQHIKNPKLKEQMEETTTLIKSHLSTNKTIQHQSLRKKLKEDRHTLTRKEIGDQPFSPAHEHL